MSRPDTPFPRHWLYYIALKILLIAGAADEEVGNAADRHDTRQRGKPFARLEKETRGG